MMPIKPFKTMLLSSDRTYPGLVLDQISEKMYNVRWFKWGYAGPDYMDSWESVETIEHQRVGYQTVAAKFGDFPLQKRTELKKVWAEKRLNKLAIAWEYARKDVDIDTAAAWKELKDFVLGLIDEA
jgi:predicted metal-dependent hydrolase